MRYVVAIMLSLAVLSYGAVSSPVIAAEKGEKLTMDQLPAPVKATLEKEAKGGTIGQVVKENEKGRTFYEATITKDGKDRYVHVGSDGKVLKRESAKKEMKTEAKEETKK